MQAMQGCYSKACIFSDSMRNLNPCVKGMVITAVALLAIGLVAAWVPASIPSAAISPCLKIGGMLAGSLILYKILTMDKEAKSNQGRRMVITLLVSSILVIGGAVASNLLVGGPAACGSAAIYIGIPLLTTSALALLAKRFGPTIFEYCERKIPGADQLRHVLEDFQER